MASYTPPIYNDIPFRFTSGGYEKPSFSEVDFRWSLRPSYEGTANLQAAIKVIQAATTDNKDLHGIIKGIGSGTYNLNAVLLGHALESKDLQSFIDMHAPADLSAVLIGIGKTSKDLLAYVYGELYKGQFDLGAIVHKIFLRSFTNLGAFIETPYEPFDLPAYLNVLSITNLPAYVKVFKEDIGNLGAYLLTRYVEDFAAYIHGYAVENLSIVLNGTYGPYDLQAYIRVYPYLNLPAALHGWYSGVFDLGATLYGFYGLDLPAVINAVLPINLGAYINAIGKSVDLGALITPNIIKLKRVISISLLESRDLKGIVNAFCFGSDYKNLTASLYTIYKKDLSAFIWASVASGEYEKDLGAYINVADYAVENRLGARFVPGVDLYSQLKLGFSTHVDSTYTVFNTYRLLFGTFYAYNLSATINGILRSVDLGASIEPSLQANYTELPEYVNPKSHEVVISLNAKGRENWRTFVEIMFNRGGPTPFKYFYVSGSNKIYRIDRDRHWTIWASSYKEDSVDMIDRKNVRTKFIFNLSNYTNIDDAIRDLISRVGAYREIDLGAVIQAILPPYSDLGALISIRSKRRWIKNLPVIITVV